MIKPGSHGKANGHERKRIVVFGGTKKKRIKIKRVKEVLRIPLGGALVVGPFQSKCVIPPFRVVRNELKGINPIEQINGMMHIVSIGVERRIRVQIYNCTSTTRMLSQKLCLVGILIEHGTK